MALFSSTQPSLRVQVLPRIPASLLAGNGIEITKSGRNYTIGVLASQWALTPKAWARIIAGSTGAPGTFAKQYGFTGTIPYIGEGGTRLTLSTAMSDTNYAVLATPMTPAPDDFFVSAKINSTTEFDIFSVTGGLTTNVGLSVLVFGT